MTRLLVVDDDPSLLRTLARALEGRAPDLTLLTAESGEEAIVLLTHDRPDAILTDLQMPAMDGFELLAWVVARMPAIPVFAMTAHCTPEATERLRRLGGIACFEKPLDVATVIDRVLETESRGVRGHVRNISLASFLQLLVMEQKTCTVAVQEGDKTGMLYLSGGELFDATSDGLRGEAAALAIAGLHAPSITVLSGGEVPTRAIDTPLAYIIMEAMRLSDESSVRPVAPAPRSAWSRPPSFGPRAVGDLTLAIPAGSAGIALVDQSGQVLASAARRDDVRLDAWAVLAAKLLSYERATVGGVDGERLEELVLTATDFCHLIRPLPSRPDCFVLLTFDPRLASLILQRMALDRAVAFVCAELGARALLPSARPARDE